MEIPELPEPMLTNWQGASRMTALSVRHLQRLNRQGKIPGVVKSGRAIRFHLTTLRAWVNAGMPEKASEHVAS